MWKILGIFITIAVAIFLSGCVEEVPKGVTKTTHYKDNEFNQSNFTDWNNKGRELYDLDEHDEAIKAFDKAIEANPQYYEAWYNKGVALVNLGKYDEAITAFDKAIEINPHNWVAWDGKGVILTELGKYDEAIKAFDKAIELNPTNSEVFNNRELALSKLNKTTLIKNVSVANGTNALTENMPSKPQGKFIFTPQEKMTQGITSSVIARITINTSEEFVRLIESNDKLESSNYKPESNNYRLNSSNIPISKMMMVTLEGTKNGAFDIKNITPTTQNVSSDNTGYTEWVWDVTPKLPGKQTLLLRAFTIEDNGYRTRKGVIMKDIHVDVNPVWWMEKNYQWILGAIIVPLLLIIGKKWKKDN